MLKNLVAATRRRTRERRARLFFERIAWLARPAHVIDLGGAADFWRTWGLGEGDGLIVTLVNNHESDTDHVSGELPFFMQEISADAAELDARALGRHDLVFSNSMLEHLPDAEGRARLCRNIEASGRPYFIQVPNKYSPIDPHFPHPLVPFFGAYPQPLKALLMTASGLGAGKRSGSYADAVKRLRHYNPLCASDLKRLFPSGTLLKEQTFGLTLSLVIHRGLGYEGARRAPPYDYADDGRLIDSA
jgi:hypothetical protein